MKIDVIRSDRRGDGSFDWLKSRFSFSFADWFDEERLQFGALRVLNDDEIAPGKGFGAHPHADFEIVTIVLEGAVAHRDSTGASGVTKADEVQAMTAGTGVTHAEVNALQTEPLKLFQIWIMTDRRGHQPRYAQKAFDPAGRQGKWQTLVSGGDVEGSLAIHQDARICRAAIKKGATLPYALKGPGRGVHLMVVEGKVLVGDETLGQRDAAEITGTSAFDVVAQEDAELLTIEVPLG